MIKAQDYYLGEIITVAFDFCPRGTLALEGQVLSISNSSALFSLLGTTYGGDGASTFGIPEARGRRLMGEGTGTVGPTRVQGQRFGAGPTATMTVAQMPAHSHAVNANNLDGDMPGPGGKLLAAAPDEGTGTETIYSDQPPTVTMSAQMIATTGGGQPFQIQDPYLGMRQCIVTDGIYPSRD
ncbi:phage tail protein [Jannaschia formosa]|nr:phage tail protein [Jannaschia formosa]